MAEVFNVVIRPSGTDMRIPVQRGIMKAAQAQALKTVYPKSLNPTVNLDKLSAYTQSAGQTNQTPKAARQVKAPPPGTPPEGAQFKAAPSPQTKPAASAPETPKGTGYNSTGAANPAAGGKFSISA